MPPPGGNLDAGAIWQETRDEFPERPPPRRLPWRLLAAIVVIGAAGWLCWRIVRPVPPEERVRRRLTNLAETVSKNSGEGNAVLAGKTLHLQDLFAADTVIEGTGTFLDGHYTAEELASTITHGRATFDTLTLDFVNVAVEITGDAAATATFVATLGGSGRDGQRTVERRPITARLRRDEEGTWRFSAFAEEQILER